MKLMVLAARCGEAKRPWINNSNEKAEFNFDENASMTVTRHVDCCEMSGIARHPA
jgi:hypothetical protein